MHEGEGRDEFRMWNLEYRMTAENENSYHC
jgi:hypothetical protein